MKNKFTTIEDVIRGIECVASLLNEIKDIANVDMCPYYKLPYFIYRGINKFYPNNINEKEDYTIEDVENDYIKSGLAVQMKITEKKYFCTPSYVRINYINALENMLINARKHYPEKYPKEMRDLDVLADIQHNGGATCLVDFSKNLLTALWFACNGEFQNDGFIYCYDIMRDMIINDSLTYIRPEDEKSPIRLLLMQTYKETNISSDVISRFCLWQPTPKNSRISRQDSVFLFGIEKFHVKSHNVKVIRIPAEDKQKILLALKGLFNISSNNIYNDHVGFAAMNNKSLPYNKMNEAAYDRGYINMIKGNYESALEFLKLWEGDKLEHPSSAKESLELHFSLAVCYKNLCRKRDKILYYENAIIEYQEVVKLARSILKGNECKDEDEKSYYKLKCTRAYNGIMDMLYASKEYEEAISVCDRIINEIENGVLKQEDKEGGNKNKEFNPRYCRITKMELQNLELVTFSKKYENNKDLLNKQTEKMAAYYKEAIEQYENAVKLYGEENLYFDKLLIEYYYLFFKILTCDKDSILPKKYIGQLAELRKEIKKDDNNGDKYRSYIPWNFADIKEAVDKLEIENISEKKRYLQYATAYMIALRDELEIQSLGKSDKF